VAGNTDSIKNLRTDVRIRYGGLRFPFSYLNIEFPYVITFNFVLV
jgi:hypothetical protein